MKVRIKLNEPLGSDLGPFDLTTTVGVVIPSTVSRIDMVNGIIVDVDDTVTTITVTSVTESKCNTSTITLNITGIPEPIN